MNMSYQYRKSHCGDKTVAISTYLHNGIFHSDEMVYWYWIIACAFCCCCRLLLLLVFIFVLFCFVLFLTSWSFPTLMQQSGTYQWLQSVRKTNFFVLRYQNMHLRLQTPSEILLILANVISTGAPAETVLYTVKPVCNDHLNNKMYTCDLFCNVF